MLLHIITLNGVYSKTRVYYAKKSSMLLELKAKQSMKLNGINDPNFLNVLSNTANVIRNNTT